MNNNHCVFDLLKKWFWSHNNDLTTNRQLSIKYLRSPIHLAIVLKNTLLSAYLPNCTRVLTLTMFLYNNMSDHHKHTQTIFEYFVSTCKVIKNKDLVLSLQWNLCRIQSTRTQLEGIPLSTCLSRLFLVATNDQENTAEFQYIATHK